MAKRRAEECENSKITVFFTQVEGSNETLQQAMQAIMGAVVGATGGLPPARKSVANLAVVKASRAESEGNEIEDEPIDAVEVSAPKVRVRTAARTQVRSPDIVDLDLDSSPTLEEYFKPVADTAAVNRYILIAYWLKRNRNIEEVTVDHIFTCFKRMNWSVPSVPLQPLIDAKSKKKAFGSGTSRGAYKLNHIGENIARKLLGEIPK